MRDLSPSTLGRGRDFQKTLLTSSCPPGDHLPTSSTLSTSTSGYTSVINNKLIHASICDVGLQVPPQFIYERFELFSPLYGGLGNFQSGFGGNSQ